MLARAKRVAVGGLAVLVAGPLAGCQLLGGGSSGDGGNAAQGSGAGQVPGPNEITASRSGTFHGTGTEGRFKLDIYRVERYGEYSLLRVAVTNLEDTAKTGADLFATGRLDETFDGFRLLDPIGRRIYFALRHGGANESGFGSWAGFDVQFQPEVRYRGVVYFPRLPENRDRITVLSPSGDTAGEFTGIPVVDGSGTPSVDESLPPATPTPGQPVELPAVAPSGDVWSGSQGLHSISDSSSARSNVSSPGRQTVALHADVLFAFDSAELSDEAQAVIQEVGAEITQRADPSEPVVVEGHTDNEGSDSYNQDLSERRAEAVHEELTSALEDPSSFRFDVSGKGEAEPVADNSDEEGRARNRRVEIEYATKPQRAASASPAPGSSAVPGAPVVGAPAPFHAEDGPVVATSEASVEAVGASPTDLTLTVHPFYRDGAYLVAVFEVAGDDAFVADLDSSELIGAGFGSFTVVDPANENRYYEVRIGESDDSIFYVDSGGLMLDGGDSGRHFAYYPAPPAGVEQVTFDAGPFGSIENVPVR